MKKTILLSLLVSLFIPLSLQAQSLESFKQDGVMIRTYGPNLGTIPKNAVRVPLFRVSLKPDQNTLLYDLTIRRNGLSDSSQFGNLWAETDRYQRTLRRSLLNDDTATLEFRSPVELWADEYTSVYIYGNMDDARPGNTFWFSLESMNFEVVGGPVNQVTPAPVIEPQEDTTPQPYVRRNKPRIMCENGRCWRLY